MFLLNASNTKLFIVRSKQAVLSVAAKGAAVVLGVVMKVVVSGIVCTGTVLVNA